MEYFDLPKASGSTHGGFEGPTRSAQPHNASPTDTSKEEEQETIIRTPVGTPLEHPGAISISTAFQPLLTIDGLIPDLTLVSRDGVHFYAHKLRLLSISDNNMGGLLSPQLHLGGHAAPSTLPPVHMPHSADVLNVVLHVIYGLSCLHYFPSFETVDSALSALVQYGVSLGPLATPNQPLYQLLLSFAPFRPLEAYACAGQYALEDAAVAISSHLLAYNLAQLPDDFAEKMGPLYLKRLFLLHQTRLDALRNILFTPPVPHPLPAPGCSPETQQELTGTWAHAAAQLAWDVLPSISTSALKSLLEPVGLKIDCQLCAAALHFRVQQVELEWSLVQVGGIVSCGTLQVHLQSVTENDLVGYLKSH
ncbi:hypothetical protein C2E23DRAFT_848943 [Lenzites betulinus]|nr:hypothetical protein C2E23DRAFT_848943 [Lenzites betulinus]